MTAGRKPWCSIGFGRSFVEVRFARPGLLRLSSSTEREKAVAFASYDVSGENGLNDDENSLMSVGSVLEVSAIPSDEAFFERQGLRGCLL